MNITYIVDPADFVKVNSELERLIRWPYRVWLLVPLPSLVFVQIYLFAHILRGDPTFDVCFGAIAFCFSLTSGFLIFPIYRRERYAALKRNSGPRTSATIVVSETFMHYRSVRRNAIYRWRYVNSIQNTKNFFFFLLTNGEILFVPYSAFMSTSQLKEFDRLARRYLYDSRLSRNDGMWPPRIAGSTLDEHYKPISDGEILQCRDSEPLFVQIPTIELVTEWEQSDYEYLGSWKIARGIKANFIRNVLFLLTGVSEVILLLNGNWTLYVYSWLAAVLTYAKADILWIKRKFKVYAKQKKLDKGNAPNQNRLLQVDHRRQPFIY
jgi:hypothetical protein